jgi:hypothetical protein
MLSIDCLEGDGEVVGGLRRELVRLRNLQELRSEGVQIAVDAVRLIGVRLRDFGDEVPVRDLNRALEIVSKTAVLADGELQKSRPAEVEALEPQRNLVLIILDSPVPDERKSLFLASMASALDEVGENGLQVVYDALRSASSEERANELLAIGA